MESRPFCRGEDLSGEGPGERTPPRCKEKDEICGVYSQFSILKTQELKRVKCDVSVSK